VTSEETTTTSCGGNFSGIANRVRDPMARPQISLRDGPGKANTRNSAEIMQRLHMT
jgi:hypothetical protein